MQRPAPRLFILLLLTACSGSPDSDAGTATAVNLDHLLSLVDSLTVADQTVMFVRVYAEAPDYRPIGATGEGIACVDDAGRMLEVLQTEIQTRRRTDLLPLARGVTRFLLAMCQEDGLWYNFLQADGTPNTTHANSVADFGWWAVRGLRGLAAAVLIFRDRPEDASLLEAVDHRLQASLARLQTVLDRYPEHTATTWGPRPAWLVKDAPDLNSELLIALAHLQQSGRYDVQEAMRKIGAGLIEYQWRRPEHELDGMFFCWRNLWHLWGNNFAYGLMVAYPYAGSENWLTAVRAWADHFVPFLQDHDFPREIRVSPDGSYLLVPGAQIAYGFTALYRGLQALAERTGEAEHRRRAEEVFAWFQGQNPAGIPMYDPATGRGYDGVEPSGELNRNAGAESTIESLLAFQSYEQR
jgi:hypothetical protein